MTQTLPINDTLSQNNSLSKFDLIIHILFEIKFLHCFVISLYYYIIMLLYHCIVILLCYYIFISFSSLFIRLFLCIVYIMSFSILLSFPLFVTSLFVAKMFFGKMIWIWWFISFWKYMWLYIKYRAFGQIVPCSIFFSLLLILKYCLATLLNLERELVKTYLCQCQFSYPSSNCSALIWRLNL